MRTSVKIIIVGFLVWSIPIAVLDGYSYREVSTRRALGQRGVGFVATVLHVDAATSTGNNDGTFYDRVTYRFEPKPGKFQTNTEAIRAPLRWPDAHHVNILYLPEAPEESMIVGNPSYMDSLFNIVVIISVNIFGMLLFVSIFLEAFKSTWGNDWFRKRTDVDG